MKNKICIVLSLVAALISCSLFADVAKTSFVKKALEPYVKSGELPGAIVVLHDNGVEEVCCAGYADVAAKRAITLDDHFMQCSQTKGFSGVTIAKLVE